jgi:hypothetical protein
MKTGNQATTTCSVAAADERQAWCSWLGPDPAQRALSGADQATSMRHRLELGPLPRAPTRNW